MRFARGSGQRRASQTSNNRVSLLLITYHLIVDLNIAHPDCDSLIELGSNLMIYLSYSSWHNTSVLVFSATTGHGECLSGTSLTIAHYGTVVTLDHRCHELLCAGLVHLILTISGAVTS